MTRTDEEEQEAVCRSIVEKERSGVVRIRLVRERLGLDLIAAKTLIERVLSGRELSEVHAEHVKAIVAILDEDPSDD